VGDAWRRFPPTFICKAVHVQLLLSAFWISFAALTLVLATWRLLAAGSRFVISRYFWVGGVIGFSVDPTASCEAGEYDVRFEIAGPGVFHNVSIHVLGQAQDDHGQRLVPPQRRATMNAGDEPIEWTFTLPDAESASNAWVVATWVRPFFEGVESEAVARWVDRDDVYEWVWYGNANRLVRIAIRSWARRNPRRSEGLRELPLFGRWRLTAINSGIELMGPVNKPLPKTRPRFAV
jgi:hypothetical protein